MAYLIHILFFLLCTGAVHSPAMEDANDAKIVADEIKLYQQLAASEEISLPAYEQLVENRVKYHVSLDREIPSGNDKRPNLPAPLYHACSSDARLSLTKKILKHGANPNAVSPGWKVSPLYNAVDYRNTTQSVEELLKAGADPNFKTPGFENSVLHMACRSVSSYYLINKLTISENEACFETIRLLLKYGANPNAQDKDGQTPLFELVTLPASALNIVAQLLSCGANISIRDNKGRDVFNYAKMRAENIALSTHAVVNYLTDWQKGHN